MLVVPIEPVTDKDPDIIADPVYGKVAIFIDAVLDVTVADTPGPVKFK